MRKMGSTKTFGSTLSKLRGKWRIAHNSGGPGKYYAVAKKKRIVLPAKIIVCNKDRSPSISVSS